MGRGHGIIEVIADWLAQIEHLERGIERVEQPSVCRFLFIDHLDNAQRHPRRRQKITSWLVNLHHRALMHQQLRARLQMGKAEQTSPAVEFEAMFRTVAPAGRQLDLLVVAVTGGIGFAVDVGEGLRVAEVATLAEGQVERDCRVGRPVGRHGKGCSHEKVEITVAPVGVGVGRSAIPRQCCQGVEGFAGQEGCDRRAGGGHGDGGRPLRQRGGGAARSYARSNALCELT